MTQYRLESPSQVHDLGSSGSVTFPIERPGYVATTIFVQIFHSLPPLLVPILEAQNSLNQQIDSEANNQKVLCLNQEERLNFYA